MTPARRLLHRLASRLGMTVEEIQAMRADELASWIELEAPAAPKPPARIEDLFAVMRTRTRTRRR